jgi:hypothetical protein
MSPCALFALPLCALCCVSQGEGLLSLAGAKTPVHVEYRDFCRPLKRLLKQMGSGSLSAGKKISSSIVHCRLYINMLWLLWVLIDSMQV